jgi:hypothetical protein
MDLYYHIDTTYEIARRLGFGHCAALFMAEGNMDVDLRHWDDEHMHGMTADPKTGKPTSDPRVAEEEWRKWIDENKAKGKSQIESGDCRAALYYLGMALHSIQDREAHKGMMNPEHSVLELRGRSPDNDKAAKKAAEKETQKFLEEFLAGLPAALRQALKRCRCGKKLTVDRPPLNMDGPVEFKLEGAEYILRHRKPKIVRWPTRRNRGRTWY